MRASARIVCHKSLAGFWHLIVVVMPMARLPLISTADASAAIILILIVATRAGFRSTVDAAGCAVVADAQVKRSATPSKELHHHQHQDEQRFRHEFTDEAEFSSIAILSAQACLVHDRIRESELWLWYLTDREQTFQRKAGQELARLHVFLSHSHADVLAQLFSISRVLFVIATASSEVEPVRVRVASSDSIFLR